MSSNNLAKIYVVAQSDTARNLISSELDSEQVQMVSLTHEQQIFDTLDELEAGCFLVDVSTNPEEELKTIAAIRARQHHMQVIAFSDQWEVATAVKAVKLGAMEILELPVNGAELKNAINEALRFNHGTTSHRQHSIPDCVAEILTSEEIRILRLIVQGLTAKEASANLDMSVRTYHYRKLSILSKLGVKRKSDILELLRILSEKPDLISTSSYQSDLANITPIAG